ncbi:MAG: BRO family protein [Treponema sp.]|nr:BRO family protein [Treponema sp.]MDY5758369.1 BRO family protein [Treponema sp.]
MFFFFFFDEETGKTEKVPVEGLPAEIADAGFEFFDDNIRYVWHKQEEDFYFSVVDVVGVLTGSEKPRRYWSDLKHKLKSEGSCETYEKIVQLKMPAADGKMRMTDVANMEQLLRIIQSIPSPKAEPFKQWLAQVGKERLDETIDPQIAIERAVETYRKQGYSEKWIKQRINSIDARNELTAEWHRAGIESGKDFATLTNVLTKAWSGLTVGQYKGLKGLHKENLRDNMTTTELALNMLAEASAAELSKDKNPKGLDESRKVTAQGGKIAGNARKELEEALGRSVISASNSGDKKLLDD